MRIPKSFSKCKNNVLSNEKYIYMQIVRQFAGLTYRELPDFYELLQQELKLLKKPNFMTINKFALKVKLSWFEQLITRIIKSIESEINLNI